MGIIVSNMHVEMHLLCLKAQDKANMELPLDTVGTD